MGADEARQGHDLEQCDDLDLELFGTVCRLKREHQESASLYDSWFHWAVGKGFDDEAGQALIDHLLDDESMLQVRMREIFSTLDRMVEVGSLPNYREPNAGSLGDWMRRSDAG